MYILETKNLKLHFRQRKNVIKALDGVDIFFSEKSITSLAGESGCGKTTLARCILKFYQPQEGKILFKGKDLSLLENERFLRQNIQIVFQNPFSSVDPRYRVFNVLYEALSVFKKVSKAKAKDIIARTLKEVELDVSVLDRYPHQLSGGQVQRIAIARALINRPPLIILDEPVSSLDITTASKIIELLKKLQAELGLTFVFISHNLRLTKKLSDFCFIMYQGKIVEYGPKEMVYNNPIHPYTKLLLRASYYQLKHSETFDIQQEGCSFRPRCPKENQKCQKFPQGREIEPGHFVFCHNY